MTTNRTPRGRHPEPAPLAKSNICPRCGIHRRNVRDGRPPSLCMDCFQVDRHFGKYPDRLR